MCPFIEIVKDPEEIKESTLKVAIKSASKRKIDKSNRGVAAIKKEIEIHK